MDWSITGREGAAGVGEHPNNQNYQLTGQQAPAPLPRVIVAGWVGQKRNRVFLCNNKLPSKLGHFPAPPPPPPVMRMRIFL